MKTPKKPIDLKLLNIIALINPTMTIAELIKAL